MKTKLFTFILALIVGVGTIFADAVKIGDLYYNLYEENKTAEVRSIPSEYSGEIVIPSSVSYNEVDYSVTGIGDVAFSGRKGLTSVTIPNSVTSIGDYAFRGCTGLTSVTIGNSVTSIGNYAFERCSGLTSIEIPNSVTSIGNAAFSGCSGLTSIEIPNSVTSIGWQAFRDCTGLTSVTIGNSVTVIGYRAFSNCSSLTSVIIPNSITSIVQETFWGCTSLTSIEIPNSVISIGKAAFQVCSGLTSIEIPNSVISIGDNAFSLCTGLMSITIPNSVTHIGSSAFYNVLNIVYSGSAADSPWGAKSVNGYVEGYFVYSDATKTSLLGCSCIAKDEIIIPNSVTSIGDYAFRSCSGLTSVEIGSGVTSIGYYAFEGCSGLTSVTNYATTPQAIEGSVFSYVNLSTCTLNVPKESVEAYKTADVWKDFGNIVGVDVPEETETTDIKTTTTDNSVDVTWPAVDGAYTYELVIKDKEGNVICTLIFDAEGRLKSIAFNAPARDDAPQKAQTASFSFTVTGLEAGTEYNLTITAKNENGQELDRKSISFHTTWHVAIEEIYVNSDTPLKVLRNDQVLILRGDKTYTVQGQQVK